MRYVNYDREPSKLKNPDSGRSEDPFRERVREVLNMTWDARDAAIFAELKRLVEQDAALKENQRRQALLAVPLPEGFLTGLVRKEQQA